jgi:hypothetical protein
MTGGGFAKLLRLKQKTQYMGGYAVHVERNYQHHRGGGFQSFKNQRKMLFVPKGIVGDLISRKQQFQNSGEIRGHA